MGFYLFMCISVLILPLTMIIMSKYYIKKDFRTGSGHFVYRTERANKSKETKEFASKYVLELWYKFGFAMLAFSIPSMLAAVVKYANYTFVGAIGAVVCALQSILMVSTVFIVENALKKNFDEYGKRSID